MKRKPSAVRYVAPTELREHPGARLIPDMRPDEWREFYNDVAFRGIRVPLEVTADGTVLDGRHRLRAALELALPQVPILDAPLGDDTAENYMLRAAVLRRHLTDDQRAAMGAMWKSGQSKQGERTDLTSAQRRAEVDASPTRAEARRLFNVSRRKVDEATRVLGEEPILLSKVHSGDMKLSEAARQVRIQHQAAAVLSSAPPTGTYQVIVVDPPWQYTKRAEDVSHRGRAPYPSMSVDEIASLHIPFADDCLLWLWTTNAFMHDAYHVLDAWGFEPKTILTWAKDKLGLGDWLRGQTEHCILAVRGRPIVTLKGQTTLLRGPLREHSRKPDEFYALVEQLCPGNKLEMFAREKRANWDVHGAETDSFPRNA